MQQAHWLAVNPLLPLSLPNWLNVWFSVYNSLESLTAQALTVVLVVGSYLVAKYVQIRRPPQSGCGPNAGGVKRSLITSVPKPAVDEICGVLRDTRDGGHGDALLGQEVRDAFLLDPMDGPCSLT
jgi:hypothetical protein